MAVPREIRELYDAGLQTLPVRRGQKTPALKSWKTYQSHRVDEYLLDLWWKQGTDRGVFVVTGHVSGVVVLDIDSAEGEAYWRGRLGDELLDSTAVSVTGRTDGAGRHYWFRCGSRRVKSASGAGWDFRAEGTGVVAPPSVHASGAVYRWERGLGAAREWPATATGDTGRHADTSGGGRAEGGRSRLSALLGEPAAEGGRNTWMSEIAGHYAKAFWNKKDAYLLLCEQANQMLSIPLDEEEWRKTAESVWTEETESRSEDADSEAAGFLVARDGRLWTTTHKRGLVEFGDFEVRARGFSDEGWLVDFSDANGGAVSGAVLPHAALGDRRRLALTLSVYGLSLGPGADLQGYGRPEGRLMRYLKAQHPPTLRSIPRYDWDEVEGGFVCDEGLIKPGATEPEPVPLVVRASDKVWHYGFGEGTGGQEAATEALREVLTWHDETVAVVYGSWWAACLVKFWIDEVSSQFPIMALRAPSESGKSTGFFPAMVALNGNLVGPHDSTRPALRDSLAANRCGIVWVDDASHPEGFRDLIRLVTVRASMRKKSMDMGQASAKLVAPLMLSGEDLAIEGEKALLDRSVMLEVPTPKNRMDGQQLQWERITAFNRSHPDLTAYSGLLLAKAMETREIVETLPSLRRGKGRAADRWAVLRVGFQVLEYLTGAEGDEERLEDWIGAQPVLGDEDALTMDFLPQALAVTGWQQRPLPATGREPPTPVIVPEEGTVAFHAGFLALWININLRNASPRVAARESLINQAKRLGLSGGNVATGGDLRRFRVGGTDKSAWYWTLSGKVAENVLERSRQGPPGVLRGRGTGGRGGGAGIPELDLEGENDSEGSRTGSGSEKGTRVHRPHRTRRTQGRKRPNG